MTLCRRHCLGAVAALLAAPALARPPEPLFDSPPPRVPSVPLLDQDGRVVTLPGLIGGGAVALNFIYTGCSSFCPPQTAIFREVRRRLSGAGAPRARLLSVSIDPRNDSPQALRRYAERFDIALRGDPHWSMLTGGAAEVQSVLAAFGATDGSLLEHPSQVWIGQAGGRRWMRVLGLPGPEEVWRWLVSASA